MMIIWIREKHLTIYKMYYLGLDGILKEHLSSIHCCYVRLLYLKVFVCSAKFVFKIYNG